MPVGSDYSIGSDPALWPPQGPMQGMASGGGVPYPMNPGTPYSQGGLDISGYPGSQSQRTPMSMRTHIVVVWYTGFWKTVPNHSFVFGYVYHCHMNSIKYFMEFIAEIPRIVQELSRNTIKYMQKYTELHV